LQRLSFVQSEIAASSAAIAMQRAVDFTGNRAVHRTFFAGGDFCVVRSICCRRHSTGA
jgi:hypothetical protein